MTTGLSALIKKVQHHSARFVMNDYLYSSRVSNMILNLSREIATLEHIDKLNLDYVYFMK